MRMKRLWLNALCTIALLAPTYGYCAVEWIADTNGCKVENPRPIPNESVAWSGPCPDGLAEGRGQLNWTVGGQLSWSYDGDMKAGRRSGQGVLTTARGVRYEGGFVDDRYSGRGTLRYPSGMVQEGEFVAGRMDGACALTWHQGDRYEGECKGGRLEGTGQIRFANGDRYAGTISASQPSGSGKYGWVRGDVYEGEFKNGKPWGHGEYRFVDGSRYIGNFSEGLPSGQGRVELPSGLGYEGNFESGSPTTPGIFFKAGTAAPEDSLQVRMQLALRYALPQPIQRFRQYPSVEGVCRSMPRPQLPVVNWKGQAVYKLIGVVRDGRVVSMDVTPLRGGVDPVAQQEFVASIERAVKAYECPGNHVLVMPHEVV